MSKGITLLLDIHRGSVSVVSCKCAGLEHPIFVPWRRVSFGENGTFL